MLNRTSFLANAANGFGGAIYNEAEASLSVMNSSFVNNIADSGGAIANRWIGASPVVTLVNTSFTHNQARESNQADISNATGIVAMTNVSMLAENPSILTATGIVLNSVLWNLEVTNSDMTVRHSCGSESLAPSDNATLLGNPFVMPYASGQAYLRQSYGTPCVDLGSNGAANVAFGSLDEWRSLTTTQDGVLEGNTHVDAGRHYHPQAVLVNTFTVDQDRIRWTTTHADSCRIYVHSGQGLDIANESVGAGDLLHDYPPHTKLTIVCFGEYGEPALASATVSDDPA